MLAEHGTSGPLVLLILLFIPLFCIWKTVSHVFVVLSLLLVLTINHAAMRTAVLLCVFLGFIERNWEHESES
jgi:hypothetical protein